MYYFAYGSNMSPKRIEDRIGPMRDLGMAVLKDHAMRFNKFGSSDKTGKANIMPAKGSTVVGVVYDLSGKQMTMLDGFERGYDNKKVSVELAGRTVEAHAYFGHADKISESLFPTADYLDYLVQGAKAHSFPPDYIASLEAIEAKEGPAPSRSV